jgi:succinate dehydrogenase flavin-adding protein (antitoxin of CptAB toxin-antitoxin module)
MDTKMIERISVLREKMSNIEIFIEYQNDKLTEREISEFQKLMSLYEQQITTFKTILREKVPNKVYIN